MKSRSLLSALAVAFGLVFVTAFSAAAADSPTEVAGKAFAAMHMCDFEKVAKLSSGEMVEDAKRMTEVIRMMKTAAQNGDQKVQAELNEIVSGFERMSVTFGNEKIEGDFAVVDVTIKVAGEKGGVVKNEKAYLRKIDGSWKLISAKEYFKANPDKEKHAKPAHAAPAEPKTAK